MSLLDENEVGVGYGYTEANTQRRAEGLKLSKMGERAIISFVGFFTYPETAAEAARDKKATPGKIKEAYDSALAARAKKFGVKAGDLTRAQLLDYNSALFRKQRVIFKKGVGMLESRLGLEGAEADKIWAAVGETREASLAIVLVLPHKKDGTLDKRTWDAQVAEGEFEVLPFRVNGKNLMALNAVRRGLVAQSQDLAHRDILLEVIDAKYSTITASPLGPAAWRALPDDKRDHILALADDLYDTLDDSRKLTTDQLRAKLIELGEAPVANGAAISAAVLEQLDRDAPAIDYSDALASY